MKRMNYLRGAVAGILSLGLFLNVAMSAQAKYVPGLYRYPSNSDVSNEMAEAYEEAVADILSQMDWTLKDDAKLLYLHDAMIGQIQYYSGASAYKALVEHTAQCDGYANAFEDLANRAGIETHHIMGHLKGTTSHAWNMVILDGKNYYIDCNWDDPNADGYDFPYGPRVHHRNFLMSESRCMKGHSSYYDIWLSDMTNETTVGSGDYSTYDSAFWRGSYDCSPMVFLNGKIYYINAEDWTIYRMDSLLSNPEKILTIENQLPRYYNRFYCPATLAVYRGTIYLNDNSRIYTLDPEKKTLTTVYEMPESERNNRYMNGIYIKGTTLYYVIGNGPDYHNHQTIKELSLLPAGQVTAQSISLNETKISTDQVGATYQLSASVAPAGAESVIWQSSDPNVATVNENGTVTTIGCGFAYIVARAGGAKAMCRINVCINGENPTGQDFDNTRNCVWESRDGKSYWYENNKIQGTYEDKEGILGEGTIRGREIYDPASDGWYWLDSCYEGAKAEGKEVWIPYIYQDELIYDESGNGRKANGISDEARILELATESNTYEADMSSQVADAIRNKTGKWVRYNENGEMLKGWVTITGDLANCYPDQEGNTYYYDRKTGLMAKGWVNIQGENYYFDEVTGILVR